MRTLERKFGKPHPELEGVKPLPDQLRWLQDAFFRLHRRRTTTEAGPQPLSHFALTDFAERTLRVPYHMVPFFVACMEITDDAVLGYVHEDLARRRGKDRSGNSPAKRRPR